MEHTISLATTDRRRSLAFYRDGLGLEAFGPLAGQDPPRSVGAPHPPPPGVNIRSTSPAFIRIVHLSGKRSACVSSPCSSSQFSPTAPGSPPFSPHGCDTRRSVMSDTVTSSSMSRSRSMPSPPGAAPAPPRPRRSRERNTRIGNDRSSASHGVFFVFVNTLEYDALWVVH
jgi:hypothetical protein